MQHAENTAEWDGAQRRRVEAVVETLSTVHGDGETLAEVAHDARNMVTALALYCDLLQEPGVLTKPFEHYGNELRLVAAASRRLVEKLVALDTVANPQSLAISSLRMDGLKRTIKPPHEGRLRPPQRWDLMPALPIDSLAGELLANRNLLGALAGPTISLSVETCGAALPVQLTGEDLTRVLVNLVKNSAEAMPGGGKIRLRASERAGSSATPAIVLLCLEDTGPGIAPHALEKIFEAGFSTQSATIAENGWPATHRGLGLSIIRSIIEAAGGQIHAGNCTPSGARFEIELPVRAR